MIVNPQEVSNNIVDDIAEMLSNCVSDQERYKKMAVENVTNLVKVMQAVLEGKCFFTTKGKYNPEAYLFFEVVKVMRISPTSTCVEIDLVVNFIASVRGSQDPFDGVTDGVAYRRSVNLVLIKENDKDDICLTNRKIHLLNSAVFETMKKHAYLSQKAIKQAKIAIAQHFLDNE